MKYLSINSKAIIFIFEFYYLYFNTTNKCQIK